MPRSALATAHDLESLADAAPMALAAEAARMATTLRDAIARGDVEAIRRGMLDGKRVLDLYEQPSPFTAASRSPE